VTRHPLCIVIAIAIAAGGAGGCMVPAPVPHGPRPDQHVVLAIVTWNVHAGRADLPRFVDDLTSGRLTGFPVRDYAILLQETIAGNKYDVVPLARERQAWVYFTQVRESKQGPSGNAILTTLMPLTARPIVLPRVRRVRKAIIASFEIEGQPMFIVDAHLENRTSWLQLALLSAEGRKRQADALLRELPSGNGIVGGDLNTWLGPDEPAWRALLKRFHDTPADPSPPTFANRLALDHLFFDLPAGWTATRWVIEERYGSDHHPLLGLVMATGRPK
jgi:endonuclease/exonuclease/phosphatase family metal-dependent hydrolase